MNNKNISEYLKNDYNTELLEIVKPLGDNFSMYVTPRFVLPYRQGYEYFSTRIVKNYIKKCDLFVDVGANYGYYTLLAADANKSIKLIAIEPIAENFDILNKNLLFNHIESDKAKCVNAAVSSFSGKINFYKSEASDNSSVLRHPNSETLEELEVEAVSLDDILENEYYKSLFIKTDTDGNELEVLRGLTSTFDKCDDITILLEMNPKMLKLAGRSCEEIIEYLDEKDFNIFAIDDNEFQYYPLNVKGNLEMMLNKYEISYFNVLCIKKKKALSIVFFSHSAGLYGAERSLCDLTKGLSEKGILSTVVLPSEGEIINILKENGCAIYVVPKWAQNRISWWWCSLKSDDNYLMRMKDSFDIVVNQIAPDLRKFSPDFIFSQTIVSPWGAISAKALNIPHVFSAREYGVWDHNLHFFFGFEESMSALYKDSNEVFCITNDVKNKLFERDEEGKTTIVYSNIQLKNEWNSSDKETDNVFFNPNWVNGVTVGIFGNISKNKGQKDIILACIDILNRGFNINCLVVGYVADYEYLENMEFIIKQSGFSECFKRHEFIENPYTLMKEVDIVVSCSQMEALGRTLIESILLRKPIIYANSGGPKEVYTDGRHGLAYESGDYHDLANKILLTIDNKIETNKRIDSAYEYVNQNFNDKNYSERIYEKLFVVKEKNNKSYNNAVLELIDSSLTKNLLEITLHPKLYYSKDEHFFNELNSISTNEISYGLFSISHLLPDSGYKYLRFDPTKEFNVNLTIYKICITTSNDEKIINPNINIHSNGTQIENQSWTFLHFEPQLFFTFDDEIKKIEIAGEIKKNDCEQVIKRLNDDLKNNSDQLKQTIDLLNQTNNKLNKTSEELNQTSEDLKQTSEELNQILTSKSWRITKPLRFLLSIFK